MRIKMNYKKTINDLRKQRAYYKYNMEQVLYDISTLPRDLGSLFEEHGIYLRKIKEIDELIEEAQPGWRKFLGVLY